MEIIDKKTMWEGSFVRTILLTYQDHNGRPRKWEAVERVNCNGIVSIVPVTVDRKFVLIRQYRPVVGRFVIEFPAGLSDKGESLIDVARRELIEETGYDSDALEFLTESPLSSGLTTEILSVFLAKDASPALPELIERYPADETENIEVITVPLSELGDALNKYRLNGDYVDLKVQGVADMALKRLEIEKG